MVEEGEENAEGRVIIWSLECETAIITCFGVSHANFLYGIR